MMMGDVQSKGLQPKRVPITDDYVLSTKVLGLGINGKVVVCHSKADNRKCALKVTGFILLPLCLKIRAIVFFRVINLFSKHKL